GHGVGQPRVERELRGFGHGCDRDEEGDQTRHLGLAGPHRGADRLVDVRRPGHGDDDTGGHEQAEPADQGEEHRPQARGLAGRTGNGGELVRAAIATRRATRLVTSGWPVHTGEPIASLTFVVPVTAMMTPVATSRLSPPMKVKNIVRRAGAWPGEPDRAMRKN